MVVPMPALPARPRAVPAPAVPRRRKPYAVPGEVVSCLHGHEIGVVGAVLPRADDTAVPPPVENWLTDFEPWQREAFLGGVLAILKGADRVCRCGCCGAPYIRAMYDRNGSLKGLAWHFKGEGWRPRRRRK